MMLWQDFIDHASVKTAKRLVRVVIGFSVLLFGVALIFLPGPAFVVIPVGLGILAGEFIWARRLLNRIKTHVNNLTGSSFDTNDETRK